MGGGTSTNVSKLESELFGDSMTNTVDHQEY